MSPRKRDTVFLEIHVQNLTQSPIWFEKMVFDCADGWSVQDVNSFESGVNIFSGNNALMQSQDMRQYMYILRPVTPSPVPVDHPPGSIIPLGRLDLSWRSSFGEPGRLLTSMLTRRIPLPIQAPVSAVPPYLKRGRTGSTSSRPSSPAQSRPGSPSRGRPASSTPGTPQTPTQGTFPQTLPPTSDLQALVILRESSTPNARKGDVTTILFTLVITARRARTVSLAVQHLEPTPPLRLTLPAVPTHNGTDSITTTPTFSAPSPAQDKFNYALAQERNLITSPRSEHADLSDDETHLKHQVILPPPSVVDSSKLPLSEDIIFAGPSAIFVPPLEVSPHEPTSYDFELKYIPLKQGLVRVGGLRVLLVEDGLEEAGTRSTAQVLWRSDVIAELWVT